MKETLYLIQPAFTTGEISPEVSNRVDLNQFQLALLQAKNVYIRPYGAAYKRGGSLFLGEAKYPDKAVLLYPFTVNTIHAMMLEIGEKYIRIWNEDVYTGIEIQTPFEEADLKNLRFCQSADILYITSGKYPVYELAHYSDTDWRFKEFEYTCQYFDPTLSTNMQQSADEQWTNVGSYTYKPATSGYYNITVAGGGGGFGAKTSFSYPDWEGGGNSGGPSTSHGTTRGGNGGSGEVRTERIYLTAGTAYKITVASGGDEGQKGGTSTAFGITARGGEPGGPGTYKLIPQGRGNTYRWILGATGTSYGNGGKGATRKLNDRGTEIISSTPSGAGWVTLRKEADNTLQPSGTDGEITLTSKTKFFSKDMVGAWIKLGQEVESKTRSLDGAGTTDPVKVGSGWKIITHGTWTGTVTIQKSINNGPWKDFRKYTAKDDQNYSETGTITDGNIRMRVVTTAGRTDFTSLAYTNEGIVQVKEYISPTKVKCIVKKELSSTDPVETYSIGSWNKEFGYPRCICFFQDRLCFAATDKQPYMVWMSRTGDYPNFSVEKASGTITDDSAVVLSFVSRRQQSIKHIIPANDLIIMTDGNEWTVSGSETVTPTKATPRVQTSRGCTDVFPILIGNRVIFIQRRGETVRDMGYDYTSDSYTGMDLTLLAKHLTRGKEITQDTYMQDPDSRIYFTESDGTINVLAYVQDQKVYAWSQIITDGKYISVCNVENEKSDAVYVAVEREINGQKKTYIERLTNYEESNDPMDYIHLDAAVRLIYEEETKNASVPHLSGRTVGVLAGGQYFPDIQVSTEGDLTLPSAYKEMIIGIPYEMIMELPNIETNTQQGTLQGRKKKISGATIRLVNSLGGMIGCEKNHMDEIKYDEMQEQNIHLFSGDKEITLPNPGFQTQGRVYITSDDGYPFTLAAIIREMVLYG